MKQRIVGMIYFGCMIIEIFIILRMVFRFFSADLKVGFVTWLYHTTEPLVSPFLVIFPSPKVSLYVIEFGSLLALIAYGILAYALGELVIYIAQKRRLY